MTPCPPPTSEPSPGSKVRLRRTRLALRVALVLLAGMPAAAQAAPPANDDFAGAQAVQLPAQLAGSNFDATLQPGEPATRSELMGSSVWYRLTVTAAETVRIDTCASPSYTELAVYSGDSLGGLTELTRGENECSRGGRAYLSAQPGTTYHIRVIGPAELGGDVVLAVARPSPPSNDDFANAQALGTARVMSTNVDATLEPGEPDPSEFGSGHSVWYRLVATTGGTMVVSACDSLLDTLLAVYTGTTVGSLTEVGRNDDFCGDRRIIFDTVPGATYHISVRGRGRTANPFTLDIPGGPPPPPMPGPPPLPTCPFQLASPGSVSYRGTHSGGGAVCLTLRADFSGVSWFHALDVPGETCRTIPFSVERIDPAAPILDRRFHHQTSTTLASGSFPTARSARGTFARLQSTGPGTTCRSVVNWSATTQATPPWAIPDVTPPALRLGGATRQRVLRRDAIVVHVRCPREACSAVASTTAARVRLKTPRRTVPAVAGRTLRITLSTRARRAIGAALRSRSSVRTTVTVVAADAAGNRTTARRRVTLRR